ncbi:MAG: hypothetical protein GC188_00755 [Alphaproteobacteria bacterium]|nr:hypothetical protein [Alphaproteobacteria bacterium]
MRSDLDSQWIVDRASGAAPLAVCVLVDSAAEINPLIRSRLELADQIGAVLMADDFRGDVMSAVPEPVEDIRTDVLGNPDPLFPSALRRYGFDASASPWRSKLGGVQGRKVKRLCEPGVDARLFKIRPGAAIPHHDHYGQELTLVLQGGFSDEKGVYHRGDVCAGQAGEPHTPVGLAGEPCICFAVSLGGYRFRNPLMSIAARMLS